jgi:hypothetical protein
MSDIERAMIEELSHETYRLSGFEKRFLSSMKKKKESLSENERFWLREISERVMRQKRWKSA